MQSTVTGKNQVTIPAELARRHGITVGSRIEWSPTKEPDLLMVRVLPDRRELSRRLQGSLRSEVKDPAACIQALIDGRAEDDPA
jgi:bifunctional DNA-binding transcriptional regulator/antitoxin component of YhaV-PrlF toxin-antitoxin module